jgi:hypothetical protein
LKLPLFLLGSLVVVAAAPAVSAPPNPTSATLTGKCTNLVVMNVAFDPTLCSGKVISLKRGPNGYGFAFMLDRQDEVGPLVMVFRGTKPKQTHTPRRQGALALPIYSVQLTFDGSTDQLVATGSCSLSNVGASCSANTIKGNFAGEFISNSVAPDTDPHR